MVYLLILVALVLIAVYIMVIVGIHSYMCHDCTLKDECEKARENGEIPPCQNSTSEGQLVDDELGWRAS